MKNFFITSKIFKSKSLSFFSIVFISILLLGNSVLAATNIELTPLKVSVKEGDIFNVNVKIVPQGVKNYTVRMGLEFPPELLSVKSWFYLGDWIPVRKAEYDVLNNDKGLFIRTAGLPGGFTQSMPFGIITFSAKKAGVAAITMKSDSEVLDAQSKNVAVLSGPVAVTIAGTSPVQPEPTSEKLKTPITEPETPEQPVAETKPSPHQDVFVTTSSLSLQSNTSTQSPPPPVQQEIQPQEKFVPEGIPAQVQTVQITPSSSPSVAKPPVKKTTGKFDLVMWIMGGFSLVLLLLILYLLYDSHKKNTNEQN